jgi:hypothetical protein
VVAGYGYAIQFRQLHSPTALAVGGSDLKEPLMRLPYPVGESFLIGALNYVSHTKNYARAFAENSSPSE